MGDPVGVVPADLGGHEIIDAKTVHDLGQSGGVTKGIRQPQHVGIRIEVLFEVSTAVKKLPRQ